VTVSVPDTAQCLHCGYALRGLPAAVCPECGNGFDPERPETFYDPARRAANWLLQRPPEWYMVFMWVLAVGSTIARFLPDVDLRFGQVLSWKNPLSILVFFPLIEFWRRAWRLRQFRESAPAEVPAVLKATRGRRRALGVALLVFYLGVLGPWPSALRFYVSWPWLAAEADRYLTDPNAETGPHWVGPVYVEQVWGRGQGFVWFQTGLADRRFGFVRSDAPANGYIGSHSRWLAPGWYVAAW